MPDQDRHAYARHGERQLGELEDLPRFRAQLRLLVEVDAVEFPVHVEVGRCRRSRAQLLHPLDARARSRLVGADSDAPEARGLVQRLQHHRQRNRAAVRVRDDAVVLGGAPAVHLRHDERHAVRQAKRGRLVDGHRAALDHVRDELA